MVAAVYDDGFILLSSIEVRLVFVPWPLSRRQDEITLSEFHFLVRQSLNIEH